jgi:hypothetical protein
MAKTVTQRNSGLSGVPLNKPLSNLQLRQLAKDVASKPQGAPLGQPARVQGGINDTRIRSKKN